MASSWLLYWNVSSWNASNVRGQADLAGTAPIQIGWQKIWWAPVIAQRVTATPTVHGMLEYSKNRLVFRVLQVLHGHYPALPQRKIVLTFVLHRNIFRARRIQECVKAYSSTFDWHTLSDQRYFVAVLMERGKPCRVCGKSDFVQSAINCVHVCRFVVDTCGLCSNWCIRFA